MPIEERLVFVRNLFEDKVISEDCPYLKKLRKSDLVGNENGVLTNRLFEAYYGCGGVYDRLNSANTERMSSREQSAFCDRWRMQFNPCELAADYLLSCKGNTGKTICYDEEGIVRLYHDPCLRKVKRKGKDKRRKDYVPNNNDLEMGEFEWRAREHQVISASGFASSNRNSSIGDYGDYEYAEYKSYENGYRVYEPSPEEIVISSIERERLLGLFGNQTEKQIADMIMQGETQKYIYQKLGITKSKLGTILHRHMKKSILKCFFGQIPIPLEDEVAKMLLKGYSQEEVLEKLNVLGNESITQPPRTKVCIRCNETLSINLFGADSRKKDGKQSICKKCDNKRKMKSCGK